MARTRVALVACMSATEGPWTLAKGNESGIEIIHLLEGERIRLDIEVEKSLTSLFFAEPGSYPVGFMDAERYRVSKELGDEVDRPAPTIVRILL